jgi:Caspase domain/Anaphase-promoting complex subunit 4 WD40 domain/WD domain, G-beta repeat
MPLSVEQLVYTSFSGLGSRTLTSEKMPESIEQAFVKAVVHPFWKNPAYVGLKMTAAYLHQLSTDGFLFGWLYCDEIPQASEELTARFVCYYSTQVIDDAQLELIFNCLEKGPVTSFEDLDNLTELEAIVLPDSNYESTRPGVPIPSSVRALNRLLLYKQKLLHCFVPLEVSSSTVESQEQPLDTPESKVVDSSSLTLPVVVESSASPELPQLPRRVKKVPTMELSSERAVESQIELASPMSPPKFALLIGVSQSDLGIQRLPGVEKDLESLQQVLENPSIGNFAKVETLLNPDSQAMAENIESFLSSCPSDSLALLYFSGYGVLDRQGTLCLSAASSRKNPQGKIIRSTFVSTDFLGAVMRDSPSRQQVVILDISLSDDDPLNSVARKKHLETVRDQLSSAEHSILVSSTAIHHTNVQKGNVQSLYTSYLVEGLATGIADARGNGIITLGEWHNYAKYKAQLISPALRPALYGELDREQLPIARAPLNDPKLQYRREVEYFSRNGQISLVNELILNDLQKRLGLSASESAKIKAEVLKPYKDYQGKLRKYARNFLNHAHREFPVKQRTGSQILYLQDSLGLTDDDIEPIKAEIFQQVNTIHIPGVTATLLSVEGFIQDQQTKLGTQFQLPPVVYSSLNRFATQSDRLTREMRNRMPSVWKLDKKEWSVKQPKRFGLGRGQWSVGVLVGLVGLGVVSANVLRSRQDQEQQRSLQQLETFVQQQKYDECETLGKSLPQSFRRFAPIQGQLEQCQVGLKWQNIKVQSLQPLQSAAGAIAFNPSASILASGSEDGKIRLSDLQKQALIRTLSGRPNRLRSIAFSKDGKMLASGGGDRTVNLWSVSTGKLLHQLKSHQNTVWSVAWIPKGDVIASGSEDGTIKLWHGSTGTLRETINPSEGAVRAIAIDPDGKTLVSGGAAKRITVWDVDKGKAVLDLEGHTNRVLALAISKNGEQLASGSADKTIKVWNLRDGKLLRTLPQSLDAVQTLSFSSDNRTLVSGTGASAQVWDVQTGQFIRQFSGSSSTVTATVFSDDGKSLAIARENGLLSLLKP